MIPTETTPPAEYLVKDFVYAGRRLIQGGKLASAVIELDGGTLGTTSLFDSRLLKGRAVGGIYRGASFSKGMVRGLGDATYQGKWADELARIDWRSRDEAAEAGHRAAKMEGDAKRAHELEELLLPLRKLYASYSHRNDYAGKEALEAALLRALRRRPPKTV